MRANVFYLFSLLFMLLLLLWFMLLYFTFFQFIFFVLKTIYAVHMCCVYIVEVSTRSLAERSCDLQ